MRNEFSSNDKHRTTTATEYHLTKRDAALLARIISQFPHGFTPHLLATSLGWPLDEVMEALETCVVYGLITAPSGQHAPRGSTSRRSGSVRITDLLSPEELKAAKGAGHFHYR